MKIASLPVFVFEACKISFFCLLVTGCFFLFNASQQTLLIVFNMAVMSSAATFAPGRNSIIHLLIGSSIIIISIIAGGILGYYYPNITNALTIIYGILSFLLPKTRSMTGALVTGTVMFLIFSFLPFNFNQGIHYLAYGLIIALSISIIYFALDFLFYKHAPAISFVDPNAQKNMSLVAGSTLIAGYAVVYYLRAYTHIQHLYWIPLTILVVIQSACSNTINIAMKRIIVNVIGAILIVVLLNTVIPNDFWWNFIMLCIFLFCIFFFGFSYIARTLFIELFVLSFTHLLGNYHNVIAYDRILLTFIGGLTVILITLLTKAFHASLK